MSVSATLDETLMGSLARLLMDGEPEMLRDNDDDIGRMARLAASNGVLLRMGAVLEGQGIHLGVAAERLLGEERERATAVQDLVARLAVRAEALDLPVVFPKALQGWPDVGGDVDVLVWGDRETDVALLEGFDVLGRTSMLTEVVAGATRYVVTSAGAPVDIHHRRLGQVGEHRDYVTRLFTRRVRFGCGGIEIPAPSPEDRIVLQGMQRLYGRRAIRLSDVMLTAHLLADPDLHWPLVVREARATGTIAGLAGYLGMVEHVGQRYLGRNLVPEEPRRLADPRWGHRLRLAGGRLAFPGIRTSAELYARGLLSGLRTGRWDAVVRYAFLPLAWAGAFRGRVRRLRSGPATTG
jgi:hypothetical protein